MSKSREIVIITEDAYGGEFFKRLLSRLRTEGLTDTRLKKLSGRKNPIHAPYLCNSKLGKILRASELVRPDFILLVYDGDGPSNYESKKKDVEKHIPRNLKIPVKILLFEYEIEEWVCKSLGYSWSTKPSDELKRRERYTKSKLPEYADKLDFEKLKRNCKSFREFLRILGD
ncbi:hypothetical protein FH039_04440 [Thermococcus indicus]|uniref:DUF4276 family protein n=1 Tax=Thermococcus indicus TaxID=2586643 RepID=A0A4Y5SJA8_9EURY|nr:hypothetical protein [Thermococcus indicus]QDA30997.1 hypothetical protein FH039_04440 [Thermococcus indicus]